MSHILGRIKAVFHPRPEVSNSDQETERASVLLISASKADLQARIRAADLLDTRRKRERLEVKEMMDSHSLSGVLVLMDVQWLDVWNEFLKGGAPPGRIDFERLKGDEGIRESARLGEHYKLIPKEIWTYFESIYGSEQPLETNTEDVETTLKSADSLSPQSHQNSTASTEPLRPRVKPLKGLVGLVNYGLYCYLNASLQFLLSIDPFRDYFLRREHQRDGGRQYCEAVDEVTQGLFQLNSGMTRPGKLWMLTRRKFPPHKMNDAHEFVHYLLDCLDSELAKSKLISGMLMGSLRSEVKCMQCGRTRSQGERFIELALPVAKSVKAALRLFTSCETIPAAYECEHCPALTDAVKSLQIDVSPSYLILALKRFRQTPEPEKDCRMVKMRKRLVINCTKGVSEYKLYGVIEHRGEDLDSGHYVAFCRRGHLWYLFDDNVCVEVQLKTVLSSQAYLLLYKQL